MARSKAKDAPEITNGGSNIAAAKSALREASDRLLQLEKEKAAINEDIAALKAEKVKPHMAIGAFMEAHKTRRLRESSIDDAEQKAKKHLDDVAFAHEALGNEQGDLFASVAAGSDALATGVQIN